MIEQHGAISFGSIEIAGQEGDRASPLAQHAAEGQGMPDGAPFFDIMLDHAHRLIGISLQPQDASLKNSASRPAYRSGGGRFGAAAPMPPDTRARVRYDGGRFSDRRRNAARSRGCDRPSSNRPNRSNLSPERRNAG